MNFLKIKFVKHYQGYVPGDITGRSSEDAELLVSQGVAQLMGNDKAMESAPVDKQIKKARIKK